MQVPAFGLFKYMLFPLIEPTEQFEAVAGSTVQLNAPVPFPPVPLSQVLADPKMKLLESGVITSGAVCGALFTGIVMDAFEAANPPSAALTPLITQLPAAITVIVAVLAVALAIEHMFVEDGSTLKL